MTRIVTSEVTYLPVNFRLYHNWSYGPDKGKPNPATFITLTLQRFVGCSMSDERYETVGKTITHLKEMLSESQARYQILSAIETDLERDAYRKAHGLEVVTENTTKVDPIITPVEKKENLHVAASDVEGDPDTGRITHKKVKGNTKKVREAA